MCVMAPIHEWNTTWFISDLASPTLAEQLPDRNAVMAHTKGGGGGRASVTTRKEGTR